jgi:hypothetical protein
VGVLNCLAEQARTLPAFELRMEMAVSDLIEEGGRISRVRRRRRAAPTRSAPI